METKDLKHEVEQLGPIELEDLDMQILKVGGCVRDEIMGTPTKDVDFVVLVDLERFTTVEEGFNHMYSELQMAGFKIFVETPEHATIRAQFPPHMRDAFGGVRDADFVLARRDGPYTDGRRPDWVKLGTLEDDLARRDFTMNAIAQDSNGNLIDPYHGQVDISVKVLEFVGAPMDRITEDALRVIRGLRFMITKDLVASPSAWSAMLSDESAKALALIAEERRESELRKMIEHDPIEAISLLDSLPRGLREAIFAGRVRLTTTLKK